jgi:hypothetical protein
MLWRPALWDFELDMCGFQLFGAHTSQQPSKSLTRGRVEQADQMKGCGPAVICDSVCDS